MRQRVRRFGPALAAAAIAVAGVLLPAGPAMALPLPSGGGWSASWSYYQSNAFQLELTIPGGRVTGYGTDAVNPLGQREFFGSVEDTDGRDRTCVRMRMIATDTGSLGSATACNGEQKVANTRRFNEALFVHIDLLVGGAITKSFFTFIPSSADDPDLRTVGTGTSWKYTNNTAFHAEVHRPGVQVIGDGAHNMINPTRLLGASVSHTAPNNGCVLGALADAGNLVGDWTCEVGAVPAFADNFTGYIKVTGCHAPPSAALRCLTMHIPEPH